MLYKIFGLERSVSLLQNLFPLGHRPRQLFVTNSAYLASQVKATYKQYWESLCVGMDSEEISSDEFALIRNDPLRLGLVNLDEEGGRRDLLPTCFANLSEEHFPLFITFDRVSPR